MLIRRARRRRFRDCGRAPRRNRRGHARAGGLPARHLATTLRVTVAQIYLPTGRYTTWPERADFYERLRAEVARESVVEGSTISLIPTGPPPTSGMLRHATRRACAAAIVRS